MNHPPALARAGALDALQDREPRDPHSCSCCRWRLLCRASAFTLSEEVKALQGTASEPLQLANMNMASVLWAAIMAAFWPVTVPYYAAKVRSREMQALLCCEARVLKARSSCAPDIYQKAHVTSTAYSHMPEGLCMCASGTVPLISCCCACFQAGACPRLLSYATSASRPHRLAHSQASDTLSCPYVAWHMQGTLAVTACTAQRSRKALCAACTVIIGWPLILFGFAGCIAMGMYIERRRADGAHEQLAPSRAAASEPLVILAHWPSRKRTRSFSGASAAASNPAHKRCSLAGARQTGCRPTSGLAHTAAT